MAVIGKDPDQQFFIKIETEKACALLCARLAGLVTELLGPKSQPWDRDQRAFAAKFFAEKGRLPTSVDVEEGVAGQNGGARGGKGGAGGAGQPNRGGGGGGGGEAKSAKRQVKRRGSRHSAAYGR